MERQPWTVEATSLVRQVFLLVKLSKGSDCTDSASCLYFFCIHDTKQHTMKLQKPSVLTGVNEWTNKAEDRYNHRKIIRLYGTCFIYILLYCFERNNLSIPTDGLFCYSIGTTQIDLLLTSNRAYIKYIFCFNVRKVTENKTKWGHAEGGVTPNLW